VPDRVNTESLEGPGSYLGGALGGVLLQLLTHNDDSVHWALSYALTVAHHHGSAFPVEQDQKMPILWSFLMAPVTELTHRLLFCGLLWRFVPF
jgi:hypothetical protein